MLVKPKPRRRRSEATNTRLRRRNTLSLPARCERGANAKVNPCTHWRRTRAVRSEASEAKEQVTDEADTEGDPTQRD